MVLVTGAAHWDRAYAASAAEDVSWFQAVPAMSLELIAASGVGRSDPILDVGGGASRLAGELVRLGHTDVTVLDVAEQALRAAADRLGPDRSVSWVHADVLDWRPSRRYALWHDRAAFHFLVDDADRRRYVATLRAALGPGGLLVVGAFAEDGPQRCSGLEVRRYAPGELAASLGEGIAVLATRREAHTTPAGVVQPFTWILAMLRDEEAEGQRK